MRLEKGQSSLGSLCGALLTCLTFCILLAYMVQKALILANKADVNMVTTYLDDHFGFDHTITNSDGLNFAIGVIDFYNPTSVFDPAFGSISVKNIKWGFDPKSSQILSESVDQDLHTCTKEELGVSENDEKGQIPPR